MAEDMTSKACPDEDTPKVLPRDSSGTQTELSEEQTHINKRMKKEHSVLEDRKSASKVFNFPDEPLVDDKHLGDDVMPIDTEEEKTDDEMSSNTEEEKTDDEMSYNTEEEKEKAELSHNYPAIKRFANKLARIPGLVECAKELLKSLNEDGDTVSPNDAFQNLWENEVFKKKLVDEYRTVRTLRGLINKLATEDRVEKHEARMAWVKEDPVLGTDLEDDADVMRKVLSLSVLYWMDINLYNIVDLREIVPMEMPDDLIIDYTVETWLDEEALRKQIDACMGNHEEAEREVAFKEILANQLRCGPSLPEGVRVR
ncbi:54S ribosomal protein l12 mitochondrial [Phtheirospermum japonicum]|uniref:54S ribosomal protein l12 mitochondrial n=1 Tax=Phtheirospermum japonicum TaxID=374723 RepID=A0A830BH25_9LAMI|nr:54S ribosomal protein l12 mitochondrial [Phtheirospermum japonicum]